jgi:hypothetical protein
MPALKRSCPCWCYMCNGRERQKVTVARHAHREQSLETPTVDEEDDNDGDVDMRDEDPVAADPVPADPDVTLRDITANTEALLDAYSLYFAKEDIIGTPLWVRSHTALYILLLSLSLSQSICIYLSPQDDAAAPSLGLLITMHLDWVSSFRVSGVAAAHMWTVLGSMVPPDMIDPVVKETTYGRIMYFVEKHRLAMAEKIPICPCGEVMYYDFQSDVFIDMFPLSQARRDSCGVCGESRNRPGTDLPRKVVYFISPEWWLRDLYQRPDVAAALANDIDARHFSPGHLRRSEGYRDKVTNNPAMNSDPRHAPLQGLADGAPYFKDKGAGSGWFFLLRHVALPEELLLDPSMAHMCIFIGGDHYETDTAYPFKTKLKRQ